MIKAINRSIAARHEEDEKGFTLIELLVVILIIGVLAAIAIPAFLNQREGAWQSQVESDLKNAAIAAESFAVANNGSYLAAAAADDLELAASVDGVSAANWKEYGFNGTEGVSVTLAHVGTDGTEFTLTGVHSSRSADTWVYSSTDGVIVLNP